MAREFTPRSSFQELVAEDAPIHLDPAPEPSLAGPFWQHELDDIRSKTRLIEYYVSQLTEDLADKALAGELEERRAILRRQVDDLYCLPGDDIVAEAGLRCDSVAGNLRNLVPSDEILDRVYDISFSVMTDLLQIREFATRLAGQVEALVWWAGEAAAS